MILKCGGGLPPLKGCGSDEVGFVLLFVFIGLSWI